MRRLPLILIGIAFTLFAPAQARAQLISPGKLSAGHAELEGIRQCTECHELGQRGTSSRKCLGCHTLVESRVAQGRGYHASVRGQSCAECHRDHLGRSVSPVRFDPSSFRHETTGYSLKGAHAEQKCRECHAPAYVSARDVRAYRTGADFLQVTYLGLPTGCASCHTPDSPHGRQLASRGCQDCHGESDWKRASAFDHRSANYQLTGAHVRTRCEGCHATVNDTVRYRGLRFSSCGDCHRTPHRGEVSGSCASCHGTSDWRRVDARAVASTFNHDRTGFALDGAHDRVRCAACHTASRTAEIRLTFATGTPRSSYAKPVAQTCASCHVDPHPRSYYAARGTETCRQCHSVNAWQPVRYGLTEHNRSGNFALDGAHAVVACNACHTSRAAPPRLCAACHRQDDPHRGAFGAQACGDCHSATDFKNARMNHDRVKGAACASCHQKNDPHQGQFGRRDCGDCHVTTSYRVRDFNHSATRYPLDGAHIRVACVGCHKRETSSAGQPFTRYQPLQRACKDCHGGAS